MALGDAALVSPYALATRMALLGTGTFSDPGSITLGAVAAILVATAVLTVLVLALSAAILDRRGLRE